MSASPGCEVCPLGSYCVLAVNASVLGVPGVQACPLGTYANGTGLSRLEQCAPCPAGYFCPSPGLIGECPAGTVSNASSTSQLQCVCAPGFTCNYNRVVTAVITLAMTEAQFTGAVRAAFLEAVALAARTTPDKVTIKRIVAAGGGASRRLLEARVYVLMEIEGGEGRRCGGARCF